MPKNITFGFCDMTNKGGKQEEASLSIKVTKKCNKLPFYGVAQYCNAILSK